jgi:ubiquinone/menaquinone biosynthesis C-methylase UbiE
LSPIRTTDSVARPLDRGRGTASALNVSYRIGRIEPYVEGRWLDFGCADGGYSSALLDAGASVVDGVDVEADRIEQARSRNLENVSFNHLSDSTLPFSDDTFDGAFVNEVLEHVDNEQLALSEIHRVLRVSGYVVVMSPNRWFPIDGHAVHIAGRSFRPSPLVPWLPVRLTRRITEARNYWPSQLVKEVREAGFEIVNIGYIWPVMERYRWLPDSLIRLYQRHFERLDDIPGLRKFGLSTVVIGQKTRRQ